MGLSQPESFAAPVPHASSIEMPPSLSALAVVPSVDELSPRERVLSRLRAKGDLPVLGLAVSNAVRRSFSETEGLQTMANVILSDVSLTQRVLRIANGSCYRRPGTPPCTLVSKAVMVIGLSTVRAIALAAALLEGIDDKEQAAQLKLEFAKSFLASVMARDLAKRTRRGNAEALSIAALFKGLGRLLVVSHNFEQFKAIRDFAQANGIDEQSAASKLMGVGFDSLGETIMREWKLPESIIAATRSVETGRASKGPLSQGDWAREAVAFSAEAACALTEPPGPTRERAFSKALAKHGTALAVDRAQLDGLLAIAGKESLDLAHGLSLPALVADAKVAEEPTESEESELLVDGIPPEAVLKAGASAQASHTDVVGLDFAAEAGAGDIADRQASHSILLAGIQEATRAMVSEGATLRDVITLVLEALYRGLHYDRVLVCLKNVTKGTYETRAALGEDQPRLMAGFRFPCTYAPDLFHVALAKNVDVQIRDAAEPGIASKLPSWHHDLLPKTRSFILLPLVLNGKILGFFYGDRDAVDQQTITKDEMDLVKALKNQVLLAVKALR